MKFALYHQEGRDPQRMAVLAENKDGTVNLGPEGGDPIVTSCVVLDAPKPGHATLEKAPADEAPGDDLESLKVDDLRALAADLGLESAGLKKADLITAIRAAKNQQ